MARLDEICGKNGFLGRNSRKSFQFQRKVSKIAKIPEIDRKFMGGVFLNNNDNLSRTHIMLYSASDSTVAVFLTDEDNLQAIYVDESAPTVIAGLH